MVERDIISFRGQLGAVAEGGDALEALHRTAFRYVEIGVSREHAALYLAIQAESILSPKLRRSLAAWPQLALTPLEQALTLACAAGRLQADVAALEILVDLLEGVNSRKRFEAEEPAGTNLSQEFELRWRVFTASFEMRMTAGAASATAA